MSRRLVWCPINSSQKSRAFWRLPALKILAIPTGIAPVFALPGAKIPRRFLCNEVMGRHTSFRRLATRAPRARFFLHFAQP